MTLEELQSKIISLEKHLMEIDRTIKELEEKVKLASIGFPVNFFGA